MRKKLTVHNSADEVQVLRAQEIEADAEKDLAFILNNSRGRRWLYRLVTGKCHTGAISHVPRDTHSTAFNEGARSVGEAILEEIKDADHTLYLKMLEENYDD